MQKGWKIWSFLADAEKMVSKILHPFCVSSPRGGISATAQGGDQTVKEEGASGNNPKAEMSQTANRRKLTVKEMTARTVQFCFWRLFNKAGG